MPKIERFEFRIVGGKTVPSSYQAQRGVEVGVEGCERAMWCHHEAM